MSTLNLTNLLASQVNGYAAYDNNFSYENLKRITYVTAANGLFRVEKTPVAIFKTRLEEYKKPIPGLNPMSEGPELLIPKMPFRFIQQALSFYLDVYDKDKTEASLLFFWNKDNVRLPEKYSDGNDVKGLLVDGQFIAYCPKQKNSSGLSEFHMDPMVDWLRSNTAILCESHSHHTMNAFFSGTDDANENATQFYLVWGKIKDKHPQVAFRYCSGDAKVKICPSALIDWPMIKERTITELTCDVEGFVPEQYIEESETIFPGPFPKIDYPSDWMGQHTKATIAASKYSYGKKSPYSYGKGKTYISDKNGALEQMSFDPYYDDDEAWYNSMLDRASGGAGKNYSYGPMEDAEIIKFDEPSDAILKNDINDNVMDLTADYTLLGYDRVIENALDAVKRAK